MIAERTRDKIAAARRKGKWTGGPVPIGYTVQEKRLVVNELEAVVAREIFRALLRTALGLGRRAPPQPAASLDQAPSCHERQPARGEEVGEGQRPARARVVKTVLRDAARELELARDPAAKVRLPPSVARDGSFELDELGRFLAAWEAYPRH